MDFYVIITSIGEAKFANAQATGTTVNLTHMAVGDGDGAYYEPAKSQTTLVNETWRGSINNIYPDPNNSNQVIMEIDVPPEIGGFTVREVGVFDAGGDLIAIGKYPETYKPVLAEGSGKELLVRMIIEVSSAKTVNLQIDPSIVLAPRSYVDAHFEKVTTWFVGDMEPEIKLPLLVWADTHEGVYKQRNLDNTAWVVLGPISGSWGVPVGTIITLAGLPAYLPGWVHLTGTTLVRADYPLLWNFALNSNNIVSDQEWFEQKRYYSFSYGDGETTFRIPRAFDFERGWDPASGLPMGQWLEDTFQGHWHRFKPSDYGTNDAQTTSKRLTYTDHNMGTDTPILDDAVIQPISDGENGEPRTGPETAPKHGLLPKLIYTGEVW